MVQLRYSPFTIESQAWRRLLFGMVQIFLCCSYTISTEFVGLLWNVVIAEEPQVRAHSNPELPLSNARIAKCSDLSDALGVAVSKTHSMQIRREALQLLIRCPVSPEVLWPHSESLATTIRDEAEPLELRRDVAAVIAACAAATTDTRPGAFLIDIVRRDDLNDRVQLDAAILLTSIGNVDLDIDDVISVILEAELSEAERSAAIVSCGTVAFAHPAELRDWVRGMLFLAIDESQGDSIREASLIAVLRGIIAFPSTEARGSLNVDLARVLMAMIISDHAQSDELRTFALRVAAHALHEERFDPHNQGRYAAFGRKFAGQMLLLLSDQDESEELRMLAAESLQAARPCIDAEFIQRLVGLLSPQNSETVHRLAIAAIGGLGSDATVAIPALKAFVVLQNPDSDLIKSASQALHSILSDAGGTPRE